MKEVYIIVAVDSNNGIGKNGTLPWHLKNELKYFAEITKETKDPSKQNLVIMGWNTWESLPEKYRPLPDRRNLVLTHNHAGQCHVNRIPYEEHFDGALRKGFLDKDVEKIFIIGGATVFTRAIRSPYLTGMYVTKIKGDFGCDTQFPPIPEDKFTVQEIGKDKEGKISYKYLFYKKNPRSNP